VFTSAAAAREELQPFVTADRKVSGPFRDKIQLKNGFFL